MFVMVSVTNSHYQTEPTIENWNTLFTQPSDLIVQVTLIEFLRWTSAGKSLKYIIAC